MFNVFFLSSNVWSFAMRFSSRVVHRRKSSINSHRSWQLGHWGSPLEYQAQIHGQKWLRRLSGILEHGFHPSVQLSGVAIRCNDVTILHFILFLYSQLPVEISTGKFPIPWKFPPLALIQGYCVAHAYFKTAVKLMAQIQPLMCGFSRTSN